MFKVYLAGPISGLTFSEAIIWRDFAVEQLAPEILAYSPLRQATFLKSEGKLSQSYNYNPLSTDKGINIRNHFDCQTADLILCNLLGSLRISTGTVMEIAWAYAYRKPLVVAMEDSLNIHDHPMIREAISFRTQSLEDAIKITKSVLLHK